MDLLVSAQRLAEHPSDPQLRMLDATVQVQIPACAREDRSGGIIPLAPAASWRAGALAWSGVDSSARNRHENE